MALLTIHLDVFGRKAQMQLDPSIVMFGEFLDLVSRRFGRYIHETDLIQIEGFPELRVREFAMGHALERLATYRETGKDLPLSITFRELPEQRTKDRGLMEILNQFIQDLLKK